VVRALLPNAAHVTVISRADGATLGELHEDSSQRGCFVGREMQPSRTGCASTGTDRCRKSRIPIRLAPILGDEALNRLAGGDPYAVLECLGSRPMEVDGVPGVRFAVWAPNARRVSVVGDFNSWDGRRHPMRLRHQAGVWELFVPRVGAGYALQIRDAFTRRPSAAAESRSMRDANRETACYGIGGRACLTRSMQFRVASRTSS
jgi:1,4-alpha-glucan branching enzyme